MSRGFSDSQNRLYSYILIAVIALLFGCISSTLTPDSSWVEPDLSYGKAGVPDGFDVYVDDTYRYTIVYPADWDLLKKDTSDTGEIIFAHPGPGEQWLATAAILVEPGSIQDLEKLAEAAESEIRRQTGVSDFEVFESLAVEVNAKPGLERVVKYSVNRQLLYQRTVYLSAVDQVFVLSFTCSQEDLSTYGLMFDDMIHSFNTP